MYGNKILRVVGLTTALSAMVSSAQSKELCSHGYPVARDPSVNYAGMPAKAGFQRDHVIPLCLGGTDTPDNVQYQRLDEAHLKDNVEHRACEWYCSGMISLDKALEMVRRWDGRR